MATNYGKGYSLEWKVKQALEEAGYFVLRSPASKSELDLIVFDRDRKLFIQCKKTGKDRLYLYGLKPLMELASRYGAKPLLAYSLYYTPIFAKEVTQDSEILRRDGGNARLEDVLRRF
jgi:Holliday junction resolvase